MRSATQEKMMKIKTTKNSKSYATKEAAEKAYLKFAGDAKDAVHYIVVENDMIPGKFTVVTFFNEHAQSKYNAMIWAHNGWPVAF
jgi:hypothetical protein